jgi:predicted transcriptional regulator
MRPPKSEKAITEKLAYQGPQSIYRLNKETGYSTSTIHAALKRLSSRRLVKKHEKGFTLSFMGLMKYFLSRFQDESFTNTEIKKVLEIYSSIDSYPLFTLHREFEGWLGPQYYVNLLSSAYIVSQLVETKVQVVQVKVKKAMKRGERVSFRVPTSPLEEVEKMWKHKYAIYFFQLTLANPRSKVEPPEDQRIRGFIKETFEEEISTTKQDVKRLESALLKLTKLG